MAAGEKVVADEVEKQEGMNLMEDELMRAYAQVFSEGIKTEVRRLCPGCDIVDSDGQLYDHPSQNHHTVCLWLTPEEQVEQCFVNVKETVDEDEVHRRWIAAMQKMTPLPSFCEYSHLLTKERREDIKTQPKIKDWVLHYY